MSAGIAIGFFTSAAAGILAALLLAPFRELGRFFFLLNGGLAFLFLCLAASLRFIPPRPALFERLAAGVPLLFVMMYLAALFLRRGGRSWSGILVLAAGAALLATARDGWRTAGEGEAEWIFALNALGGALLLGAVSVGMLLGHWYLVRTRLDVSHLMVFARLFGAMVLARGGLVLCGLLLTGARSSAGLGPFLRTEAVDRGVFFWQRVFFGILGPAVFAWMVHETARIRSTQSATGILYIATIFVVYGEFLARYLSVAGAGPL